MITLPLVVEEDPRNATAPVVKGWKRRGGCTHCGWCCEFVGMGFVEFPLPDPVDRRFCGYRGITQLPGGKYSFHAHFHRPCGQFDGEIRRCKVQEDKPATCLDYPVSPDQIEGTPCTYWFEKV